MQNIANSSVQNENDNLDTSIVSTGTSQLNLTLAQETAKVTSNSNTWKHLLRMKLKRKIENEIAEEDENYKVECAKEDMADLEDELKNLQEEYGNYCERTKQESLKANYLNKNLLKCESYLALFEEDLTKLKTTITSLPKDIQEKHNSYLKQNELYKTLVIKSDQVKNNNNLLKEIKLTKTDTENKHKECEQQLLEDLNGTLQELETLKEDLKTVSKDQEECKVTQARLNEELNDKESRLTTLVVQLQEDKDKQRGIHLTIDKLGIEQNNAVSQLRSKLEEKNIGILAMQENLQILKEERNALQQNVNAEQVIVHRIENELKETVEKLKSITTTKEGQEDNFKSTKKFHEECLTELNFKLEKNSSLLSCQQIKNKDKAEECVQLSKTLDKLEFTYNEKKIKLNETENENCNLNNELQKNSEAKIEKETVLKNIKSYSETFHQKFHEDLNEYTIVKNKLEKMQNDSNLKQNILRKEHQNRLKNLLPLHAHNEKLEENRSKLEQYKLFLLKEISEKETALKEEEGKKVVGILKSPGNRASIPPASKSVTFRNSISWASDSYDALLEELTRSSNDTTNGNKVQPKSSPPTKLPSKQKSSSFKPTKK